VDKKLHISESFICHQSSIISETVTLTPTYLFFITHWFPITCHKHRYASQNYSNQNFRII